MYKDIYLYIDYDGVVNVGTISIFIMFDNEVHLVVNSARKKNIGNKRLSWYYHILSFCRSLTDFERSLCFMNVAEYKIHKYRKVSISKEKFNRLLLMFNSYE